MLPLIVATVASYQAIACGSSYQSTSSLSFLANKCLFRGLSGTSYGGAIFINSATSTLSVESSIFDGCAATIDGGAIYISALNLSIQAVCAFDCQAAADSGQFCFSLLSTGGSGVFIELSICRCANSTANGGYYPFWIRYGNFQNTTYLNSSSNNVANWGSTQLFYSVAFACAFYTNHFNNTALTYIGLYFATVTTGIITQSNMISNNDIGVITLGINTVQVSITNCVFAGNTGSPLFYVISGSGSYIASNCWISHSGTICGSGVQTTLCVATLTDTVKLFSTRLAISGDSCNIFEPAVNSSALFSTSCVENPPIMQMMAANCILLGIEF